MKKILIILFLAISSAVSATTYYVSSTGNNNNNGLTTTTPWQTVQYAEAHATNAGDIIALKKGDVWVTDIALGIHHGGIAGNPIIWDGALWGSGAGATIRSNSNRTGSNMSVVNITGCSYVTFRNITVDGNNTYAFGLVIGGTNGMYSPGGIQNSENSIIVQNCSIINIGNGVNYSIGLLCQTWKNDISDITIKGNTFNGSDDEQLAFYGGKTADGGTPAACKNVYIGYNTLTNWGRRGQTTGYGMQINNKITDVIIEYNNLTTGSAGHGNALQIESNESVAGWFPLRVTVRNNKFNVTLDNTFCIYITQGQAKTVDVYSNLLTSSTKTANGGGIWVVSSSSPSWSGAVLNFYNNTIYTNSGRSFTNDCSVPGVVTLKNNIFYNTGSDDYGMMCLVSNTAGATVHGNNLYFRSANANYTKVKDGAAYQQTASQVLSWEAGAVVTDPLFKSPVTDFHLQAGSPGIGAGVAIPVVTKDIDGVAFSSHRDIGCYQSQSTQAQPVLINCYASDGTPSLIQISYDITLANIVPSVSAYNVQVNSVDRPLSSVAVTGTTVNLTLASPLGAGDVAKVSYTRPVTNPLQSTLGGQAASISLQPVTNNVITAIPPVNGTDAKMKIKLYPNPVHHILNISCEYTTAYSVQDAMTTPNILEIVDMSGRLVMEKILEPGAISQQIPINLHSGVFIVLLISKGITHSSQKLIVYD